jgi:hypothetical protein
MQDFMLVLKVAEIDLFHSSEHQVQCNEKAYGQLTIRLLQHCSWLLLALVLQIERTCAAASTTATGAINTNERVASLSSQGHVAGHRDLVAFAAATQ